MDIQVLTEIAYKNGYKKGIEDFIEKLQKEYSSHDEITIGYFIEFILDEFKEEMLKKYE